MSNPKIITPPSQVISTAEAKLHCRIDSSTEDASVVVWIEAARKVAQQYLSVAVGPQTLELAYDTFPDNGAAIQLRYGPVQSISSVTYVDDDSITQTIDSANYSLDAYNGSGWIIPAVDYGWPTPIVAANAVKVRYVTGDASLDEAVKMAILAMVCIQDQNRVGADLLSDGVRGMLDTVKVYG